MRWDGIDMPIHSKWISVDLLWCWYKWGEYILLYTHITRYVYNFRFLFVSRLEPMLFFINSITFQFVWRDVDGFFFFFSFFSFFFQFSILKLKYVYYTCFNVLKNTPQYTMKPQPAAAEHRQKQQQHQLEAFVDVINRLKNWRYSKSAFTFSLWRFFSPAVVTLTGWFTRYTSYFEWDDREPHSH